MFKPCAKFILVLLIFASGNARGQDAQQLFDRYIKLHFFTSPPPDTLNISIKKPAELEPIINSGLQNKVYSVTTEYMNDTDLAKTFNLLVDFKNLTFLKINEGDGGNYPTPKSPTYQLPANIQKLQQLKGFEFYESTTMDINDAVKKIATLKQLQLLSFFACNYPLPAQIAELKNIKAVRLGPRNIANIDVSQTNWQIVDVFGFDIYAPKDDYAKTLANLSQIKSLQHLYLSNYNVGNGAGLTEFKQISTLELTAYFIKTSVNIFEKIGELKQLHSLTISSDFDSVSFKGIQNLKNLTSLSMHSFKGLDKYPERLTAIASLTKLESLTLHNLELTYIPDIFTSLTGLKRLSIAGHQISQIPESIFKLPHLEYLDVSSNRLTTLPDEQNYGCKNLKTLIVSFNGLTTLPSAITRLSKLEKLDAWCNLIKSAPSNLPDLKNLKEINLSINKLIAFPDGLQLMPGLEKIVLDNNDISFIPDITQNNYRLKFLSLNGNKLTKLPEHIGYYTELEYLNISGNNLQSLPLSLGNCKKLNFLSLYSNKTSLIYKMGWDIFRQIVKDSTKSNNIKFLPPGLKDAKNLETLFLGGNPLIDSKSVFDVILSIPRKNFRVDISHDNISEIPDSPKWAEMTFDELDLSYNKLMALPIEFTKVKASNIKLDHNLKPLTLATIAK